MFDKDNHLNSLASELEKVIKNSIPSKLNITNSNITVQRQALNITSISNQNQYYILLLFPRSSRLAFSSEGYGTQKKRKYRIDIFIVAQQDSLCQQLAGKLQTFVDKNEFLFTSQGMKKPLIRNEFLKVADSKIYNSGTVSGSLSAMASTFECEILI